MNCNQYWQSRPVEESITQYYSRESLGWDSEEAVKRWEETKFNAHSLYAPNDIQHSHTAVVMTSVSYYPKTEGYCLMAATFHFGFITVWHRAIYLMLQWSRHSHRCHSSLQRFTEFHSIVMFCKLNWVAVSPVKVCKLQTGFADDQCLMWELGTTNRTQLGREEDVLRLGKYKWEWDWVSTVKSNNYL